MTDSSSCGAAGMVGMIKECDREAHPHTEQALQVVKLPDRTSRCTILLFFLFICAVRDKHTFPMCWGLSKMSHIVCMFMFLSSECTECTHCGIISAGWWYSINVR